MGLATLEDFGIGAHGINTIAAPQRMLQRADSIALPDSRPCCPQKWSD
jgi:hypothetical protein